MSIFLFPRKLLFLVPKIQIDILVKVSMPLNNDWLRDHLKGTISKGS